MFAALLIPNSLSSQECGPLQSSFAWEINGSLNKSVNIYWVVVNDDDCTQWIDISNANSIIKNAEDFFLDVGITLNRVSCHNSPFMIDAICSSVALNDHEPFFCNTTGFCLQDALTVFLYPESFGGLNGRVGMVLSIPGTAAFVRVTTPDVTSKTIIHELAHCFGLIHTNGTRRKGNLRPGTNLTWSCNNQGGIDYARDFPTQDCNGDIFSYLSIFFERVDGSNSSVSGDFVTDTPADIGISCTSNGCDDTICDDSELNKNENKDPNCQKYRPDKRNLMRQFVHECADRLSSGQVSRMKGVLDESVMQNIQGDPCDVCPDSRQNFCHPCHESHEHLNITEVNGVVNVDVPTLITNDLTIKNGTLNVHSTLYIAPGVQIWVKEGGLLNIVGGHMTSCDGLWGGVILNSPSGEVRVTDGSLSKAVSSITGLLEGTIYCENAHFYDNSSEGVFIWGDVQATFNHSHFNGMPRGVLMWRGVHPVVFNNCTFAYQSDAGISSYGTEILVEGNNQFIGSTYGITLENPFGHHSSNVIGSEEAYANQFSNCYNGVYSGNTNVRVFNSYFTDNTYGSVFRGTSEFMMERNSFQGLGYAELIDGTGGQPNQSFQNEYDTHVGIYPHNNNDGYGFHNNCFNTLHWDVDAHGVIHDVQFGPNQTAAANCFSGGNNNDFMARTSNQVIYGIPDVPVADCYFPDNNNNYNYINEEARFSGDPVCGPRTTIGPDLYSHIRDKKCNISALRLFITSYLSQIRDLQAQSDLTRSEYIQLKTLERQLQFAINQLAWCQRKTHNLTDLKELYREFAKEDISLRKEYAIKMAEVTANMGYYASAKNEIDSIALVFGLHSDIISSLKLSVDILQEDMNLSYLSAPLAEGSSDIQGATQSLAGHFVSTRDNQTFDYAIPSGLTFTPEWNALTYRHPTYELSQIDFDMLCRVSQMTEPEAAYGRALLSYMTGMRIQPQYQQNVVWHTQGTEKEKEEICSVYPNPSGDVIHIRIDHAQADDIYTFFILDNFGRTVMRGSLNEASSLDISNLVSGVYGVYIHKTGRQIDIKRFVKN